MRSVGLLSVLVFAATLTAGQAADLKAAVEVRLSLASNRVARGEPFFVVAEVVNTGREVSVLQKPSVIQNTLALRVYKDGTYLKPQVG
jgi:hypothetical protein